jgi:hypothetical protein
MRQALCHWAGGFDIVSTAAVQQILAVRLPATLTDRHANMKKICLLDLS